ncbi:MAG: tripartite tricarboxylate transporter TctB family protein [Burkholderiales bacterium]|nr:tripartite tricarboxylate transporter TctB family protein [Burkholderiales bacterium]
MKRIDRGVGLALVLLAAAVLWSARSFPNVPGQKLGAGTLPTVVGAGLLLCGLVLALRGWRSREEAGAAPMAAEHYGSAFVIVVVIALYLLASERLGFLLLAPLALAALFRAFRVGWLPTLCWAIGGTLVVHIAFYKLLRVPLPWGVLRPLY